MSSCISWLQNLAHYLYSPQPRRTVKDLYTSVPLDPHNILPLRFNEADISLAHVLALCTPPPEYPNRERILTSVQFIVSRRIRWGSDNKPIPCRGREESYSTSERFTHRKNVEFRG